MQIRLADGTILECISIFGKKGHYQGANREFLEFHISPETCSFEQLDQLTGDSGSTHRIYIIDDNGDEFLHEHFVIRKELALKQVEVSPETADAPAQYETRIIVELAQLTYAEVQLQQLQEADLDNKEAIATLYEMFLGGSVIHG